MKKLLLVFAALFLFYTGYSQTVLFSDDFENGTTNWIFSGTGTTWGLSTLQAHSPTSSLSESPTGNYAANKLIYATMANGIDLTGYLSADLTFWATYKIEGGFDYMYLEVSDDNFVTYATLDTYDGGELSPLPPFSEYTYSLSGYCGSTNVKIRFRFYSDGGYETDGMYIDDIDISGSNVDNAPPMIVHTPRAFYEGRLLNDTLIANIIDVSGISAATLVYTTDNGIPQTVTGTNTTGNQYQFVIPAQTPGAWMTYYIYASDNSTNLNEDSTATYEFIAGNHIIYDNTVVDFFGQFGPTAPAGSPSGAAVKIALGNTDLVTLLIRNYTDNTHPNDSMLVHVWDDNGGHPGNDVITPFKVKPAATLSNTSAMTRIDLRTYAASLSGLTGTYYIGFTVPIGVVNLTMTQPGIYNRSYNLVSGVWEIAEGQGGLDDFHFRAVTSLNEDVEGPVIANDSLWVDYHSTISDQLISAQVSDMSGVENVELTYWVDNGTSNTIAGTFVSGDKYTFTVPAQVAGAWVKYIISADDMATTVHSTVTDTFRYITGQYYKFDNNNPQIYIPVTTTGTGYSAAAQKINFGAQHRTLVTLLIKNYYSSTTPISDPMEIHLWGDDAGFPNMIDLITPIAVPSEANAANVMTFTKVDLRSVSGASHLTGTIYAGIIVPTGTCAILGDTVSLFGNSFAYSGGWMADDATNYHIRFITSDDLTTVSSVSGYSSLLVYPNPSNGLFYVDTEENSNVQIFVYDVTGKMVFNTASSVSINEVNLTNLSKGVYSLKVVKGNEVYNQRIVLE